MPGGQVGHQRHAQHLCARRARRDRLVHGRHAHQVGAQRAQHPDLGRRLVVRPGQRRRRRPRPASGSDFAGQRRAARANTRRPGRRTAHPTSGERAVRFRWSLISTGWPDRVLRAQSACGVGQHDGVRARRARRPDRVHDVAQLVALVGVDAAEQAPAPAGRPTGIEQHLPAVAGRGRRGEARDVGHRHHRGRRAQLIDRGRPPRSQHDRHVVVGHPGALGDDATRRVRRCGWSRSAVGHDRSLTESAVRYCSDAHRHRVVKRRGRRRPSPR